MAVWALSLGLTACAAPVASTSAAPASVPSTSVIATSEVVDLTGVDQLAEVFNAGDPDIPKLILLLSPT